MEFHICREARDCYGFDENLFSLNGNVIFADFHAARVFTQRMNDRRDLIRFPETAVKAGQINAMGLIDEIMHLVVRLFQERVASGAMGRALLHLRRRIGKAELQRMLLEFTDNFPPVEVYRGKSQAATWLKGKSEEALEELLMLWLANQNPAFAVYLELFDDSGLEKNTVYRQALEALTEFFEAEPCFGPDDQSLIAMLRAPALAHPHSLSGQLEYIRQRWGGLLGDYLYRLLSSLDFIGEEMKLRFLGPGPSRIVDFKGLDLEAERFSPDLDWMPRVVMIAKNSYVWLDQLSKRYQRQLRRLDEIPDEELDRLSRWGITALWLIGLWERSKASRLVKQRCGNPEAEASAYSLLGYEISPDLGGWEAFNNLKNRAWQRGIRMAGDMVPNHMGIDSRWVIEHPDWFVSLPYSPFPSYTFGGPDLSDDPRAGVYLEDHYYSRSDAAVVFKRVDTASGEQRFIYHGNDGTSMPWNDTAQLNFLNPEVREGVIQTILHVAKSFPIIRFDAAMTLTKKHYQRLWFPEPGSGGDISSRSDHGMSSQEFNARMPREFWREVVERVAREVPDTLLLAEAFWLLEGYFVRTLGMHRVYNSAFMNMLKNEENSEYRQVIKKTLAFNPEILKRFVNFMNNPDEETAVAQFGKGDKYFGVCTLMATLPGLPMFGHGQIEGFSEKYGMEYRRAYWDEKADEELVDRHEREIFPLLARRYLFADSKHFQLYDFYTSAGSSGPVNEDVFAYSNRRDGERALIVYNNRFAEAAGWIHLSSAKAEGGQKRAAVQHSVAEGLGLSEAQNHYCIFRDLLSGLQYLRSCQALHRQGLYVELRAYQAQVFLDFREVQDSPGQPYAALCEYLAGRGVPNVEQALREILLKPIHQPFAELVNADMFRRLSEIRRLEPEVRAKIEELCSSVAAFTGSAENSQDLSAGIAGKLSAFLDLSSVVALQPAPQPAQRTWAVLLGWLFVHWMGPAQLSRSRIDDWMLGKLLAACLRELGLNGDETRRALALIKILTSHQRWFEADVARSPKAPGAEAVLETLLSDSEVQEYLAFNRYRGALWFHSESLDELLEGLLLIAALDALAQPGTSPEQREHLVLQRKTVIERIQAAKKQSDYQVEKLLAAFRVKT